MCVWEYVWERGEGEGNSTIMFLTSLSHSAVCLCGYVCGGGGGGGQCIPLDVGEGEQAVMLLQLWIALLWLVYMLVCVYL